jgi:hypothetical protein
MLCRPHDKHALIYRNNDSAQVVPETRRNTSEETRIKIVPQMRDSGTKPGHSQLLLQSQLASRDQAVLPRHGSTAALDRGGKKAGREQAAVNPWHTHARFLIPV